MLSWGHDEVGMPHASEINSYTDFCRSVPVSRPEEPEQSTGGCTLHDSLPQLLPVSIQFLAHTYPWSLTRDA